MKWIKSSRCDSAGCVEVAFVKSSRSASNGACVEVAACDCHIKVRDSKDPDGPVLTFTHQEWGAFCAGVRAGEFGTRPALACPMPDCDHFEWVSDEDPDATLSVMVGHLRGFFRGQHRLDSSEAMQQLALVREVRR